MGILNVTPDSFSDGGLFENANQAFERARELLEAGAHVLDLGGVSTRPGSEAVSEEIEMGRVLPLAKRLREQFSGAVLSIDTFRPGVARALAEEGAVDLINDVYAGQWVDEQNMGDSTICVARDFNLGLALMHMRGEPKTMQNDPHYGDCLSEVSLFLRERALAAKAAGVQFVCVDPGIGFGKRFQDNLDLLSRVGVEKILEIGFPLLIGLSRKRFLVDLFKNDSGDLSVPRNRDVRSKELELRVVDFGANIIRTHRMPSEVFP
jgi:dihydropteroate synthase